VAGGRLLKLANERELGGGGGMNNATKMSVVFLGSSRYFYGSFYRVSNISLDKPTEHYSREKMYPNIVDNIYI
jgi:hypothetical protein